MKKKIFCLRYNRDQIHYIITSIQYYLSKWRDFEKFKKTFFNLTKNNLDPIECIIKQVSRTYFNMDKSINLHNKKKVFFTTFFLIFILLSSFIFFTFPIPPRIPKPSLLWFLYHMYPLV